MPSIAGCPDRLSFERLVQGRLAAEEVEQLAKHLESCERCVETVQGLQEADTLAEALRGSTDTGELHGPVVERVIEQLKSLRDWLATRAGDSEGPWAGDRDATPDADYAFLAPAQGPDEMGRLGPYRVLKVLGSGGMGCVFLAEDPQLQRLVALKVMMPGLASSPASRQRFLREARAAAAVKHDHIVTIHQVGEDRGVPFLAMELLEGETLDARLRRLGRLPISEVLGIGQEVARGLAAAHRRGLLHRDIKPANIWLEKKDEGGRMKDESEPGMAGSSFRLHPSSFRVKIVDFGLARAASGDAQLTQEGAIIGTPAYMAPEQATNTNVDHRCDLFSLGCVLYRMAAGVPPFKGTDTISTLMSVATDQPVPPCALNFDIPTELSDFIMKLLEKSPERRPASAQEVAERLRALERERLQQPAKVPQPRRVEPRRVDSRPAFPVRNPSLVLPILLLIAPFTLVPVLVFVSWFLAEGSGGMPTWFYILCFIVLPILVGVACFFLGLVLLLTTQLARRSAGNSPVRPEVARAGMAPAPSPPLRGRGVGGQGVGQTEPLPQPLPETGRGARRRRVLVAVGLLMLGLGILSYFYGGTIIRIATNEGELVIETNDPNIEITVEDGTAKIHDRVRDRRFILRAGKDYEVLLVEDGPDGLRVATKKFHLDRGGKEIVKAWMELRKGAARVVPRVPGEALVGEWSGGATEGDDWGKVVVRQRGTEYTGTYTATFDKQPGNFSFKQTEDGKFVGEWWESERRRGTFTLSLAADGKSIQVAWEAAQGDNGESSWKRVREAGARTVPQVTRFTNSLGMEFALVPKGKFFMGARGGVGDKEVEFRDDFYLGVYEVTQEEWEKVTGVNPSHFSREGQGKDAVKHIPDAELKRLPVDQVSWHDARLFVDALNAREKEAGWVYRLPKEAEWEYACRGGSLANKFEQGFDFHLEKPTNQLLPEQANFEHGKGLKRTCMVGSYRPNRLGLYDMHGNVWEWCDDAEKVADLAAPRMRAGGGWDVAAELCAAAKGRYWHPPGHRFNVIGMRVARVRVNDQSRYINSLGMEFALVPKGKAWMGGMAGTHGHTEVEFKDDFYLGVYEVTQEEWQKVMGVNPSEFSRTGKEKDKVKDISDADLKRFPVTHVSWNDCQEFITRLNEKTKESGWVYRFPKADEWQYACRGGSLPRKEDYAFDYYLDRPTNSLQLDKANFNNTLGRPAKVGSYPANPLGLHDMHGNMAELLDEALPEGKWGIHTRITRGGGFSHIAEWCKTVFHVTVPQGARFHDVGLRLARVRAPVADAPGSPDADRRAAEWVLNAGGKLGVICDGKEMEPKAIDEVGTKVFQVAWIEFLNNPRAQDAGLENLKGLTRLSRLSLVEANITGDGLKHLAALPSLGFLDRSNSPIIDQGVQHLLEMPALHEVWLHRTKVTDSALDPLGRLPKLRALGLMHTQVTDAGLQQLEKSKSLTLITLEGSKVTEAGVKKLAAALPKCKIDSDHGTFGPGAGDGDCRVAEWVLSVGGQVTWTKPAPGVPTKLAHIILSTGGNALGDLIEGIGNAKPIDDLQLENLRPITALEALSLNLQPITDAGLARLAALPGLARLRALHLPGTKVTDNGVAHFQRFNNLNMLSLAQTEVGDDALKHLAQMPQLTTLYLDRNGRISDAGLAHLRGLKLQHLHIGYNNKITDAGMTHLADMQSLTHCWLPMTSVGDAGLAALKKLKLEHLTLDNTKVTDAGLEHVAGFDNLRFLAVANQNITAAGLAKLKNLKQLRALRLGGTRITADDLPILQEFKALRTLIVYGRNIDDGAAFHLSRLGELTSLWLSDTAITDAGLEHLKGLNKLRELKLTKTKVTVGGVKKLAAALPKCKIESDHGTFGPSEPKP